MKREFFFVIPGVFVGLLIGWILGSQRAEVPARGAAQATTTSNGTAQQEAAPPLDIQRAAALEKTANAEPNNASARIALADLYFDARRFDQAIPWYETALKIDAKNIDASTDLGVCYFYLNQVDRALAQFEKSLALNPSHPKTLFNQGIVRAYGKQDLKGATESWNRLVAVAPDSLEGKQARQLLEGLKTHPDVSTGSTPPSGGRGETR